MPRSIRVIDVRRNLRQESIAIAAPNDFVRGRSVRFDGKLDSVLPYCLDFANARALYVTDVDINAAQQAPFYYLHLRRRARKLVSVPVEAGPIVNPVTKAEPIFFFSPGRCGSTLVSRLLVEAGIATVSEPDFFTQMSSLFWSSRFNPLREPFRRAMWNMTGDLSAALGVPPVVKLRAECAKAPELFLRHGKARTIVMFRGFESWARSTARVFGNSPRKMVRKYLTAMRCFAVLQKHSRCLPLLYEDLVADPAGFADRLGGFLGTAIPSHAVARAMAKDAQECTPLARMNRTGWESRFDGAMRLWASPRLAAIRYGLALQDRAWQGEKSLRSVL